MAEHQKCVIEPEELQALLESDKPVRLIDATFVMPGAEKKPLADFEKERIDGAVFFDIDGIADHETTLPHMLPRDEVFAAKVGALGISNSDFVVVYAQHGMVMGPARAWWMFKTFGHDNVAVLNGGMPAWKAAGLPVNTEPPGMPDFATFIAHYRPELVCDLTAVSEASEEQTHNILDARPAARFNGEAPEPRSGLSSGHIPGSRNLPCTTLVDEKTGKLKPESELRKITKAAGFDAQKPTINTCGSGVTACMNALVLYYLGYHNHICVYDGSWAEWGQERLDMPLKTHTS